MADNQITPFQLTDQFTMDNFNQRINETNTALQNKAPSGFGYGDVQSIIFWDDEDGTKLEQALEAKFAPASMRSKVYRANLVDRPICKVSGNGGFADIIANNGNDPNGYPENIMIVYYAFNKNIMGPSIAVKQKINGTWYPWEYVNPPMELGVEYRTTERYLGKPVYVKAVNIGTLPNNSSMSVNITTKEDGTADEAPRSISAYGITSNGVCIPAPAYARTPSMQIELQPYVWVLYLQTNFDASNLTGTIVVKYYKTTD